jgi:transposase-like protein
MLEITLLANKGDITLNQIGKKHQVTPSQIHNWIKHLLTQGSQVFDKANKSGVDKNIEAIENLQKKPVI